MAFADIWSLKLRIICRTLLSLTCVSLQEREVIFNDINSMLIRTSHKIEPTVANFWALNSWLLKEHWLKELSLLFQLIQNKYWLGVYFQLTPPPPDLPEWNNIWIVAIVEIKKRFQAWCPYLLMFINRKTQTSWKKSLSLSSKLRFPTSKINFLLFTICINWQGYQNALVSSSITRHFQILASSNSLV